MKIKRLYNPDRETLEKTLKTKTSWKEALESVVPIVEAVRIDGDKALKKLAKQFDGVALDSLEVPIKMPEIAEDIWQALKVAAENIRAYHKRQLPFEWQEEIQPGITVGEIVRPLEIVGCYIPGGRYPLVSTILMTAIPAMVAGVEKIIVCAPKVCPEIIAACAITGVDALYQVGGAHSIAAMAYGTETIPKVDKIVGPGNRYVTAAKKWVVGDVGIDFLAGPSEVLIVADDVANPSFLAADLLAQAEHDTDATAILVTFSEAIADRVEREIEKQLNALSTREIAQCSLEQNGLIIITSDLEEAFRISNTIAPEHLELQVKSPLSVLKKVKNAGAVFLGEYSVEAAGDYASGPNHVLPTGGVAKVHSGLSVRDFMKTPTLQFLSREGLQRISPSVWKLAEVEGLEAHMRSVLIRGENNV
ncbi:MAG: histidinol dehydrogenase [Waddliaceae bacterium]